MRILLLLACSLLLSIATLFAQKPIMFDKPLPAIAVKKIRSLVNKDEKVDIVGAAYYDLNGYLSVKLQLKNAKGEMVLVEKKDLDHLQFVETKDMDLVWAAMQLQNGGFDQTLINGMQYDLRKSLNDDAVKYISTLNDNKSFFVDDYFNDYLYRLINKIKPSKKQSNQASDISVCVVKDVNPRSFALSNGCIILTTGLLSILESEDELVGILAQEIAHVLLDQQVANQNEELRAARRATFWSDFAVALAATTEIVAAARDQSYISGGLTENTAILSQWVSADILAQLGASFNQKQTLEADRVAQMVCEKLNYDKHALSMALLRIQDFCKASGNYGSILGGGDFENISTRLANLGYQGSRIPLKQPEFLKKASMITTETAWTQLWFSNQMDLASSLAQRNIDLKVATESDYLVVAISKRRTSDTQASNEAVLALLNEAKEVNVNQYAIIYKEEALTLLQMGKEDAAVVSLKTYLQMLLELQSRGSEVSSDISWAKTMIYKFEKH